MEEVSKSIKYFKNNNMLKPVQVKYIVDNIKNLNISSIKIKENEIYRTGDKLVEMEYTDFENPFVLEDGFGGTNLLINQEWYLKNTELVDQLINFIAYNTTLNKLSIEDSCLITDKLKDYICLNKNLKKINLDVYSDNGYILNKKDYLKFKNAGKDIVRSKGVTKELEENFDSIIGYNSERYLIGISRYEDLSTPNKDVSIKNKITDEELENLKYLNPTVSLRIYEENFDMIEAICNKLKSLNLNNKLVLIIEDKNTFNNFIFSNKISGDNIYVDNYIMKMPLKNYLNFEKTLYQMIEPAKNLSPFEKYIYAYNIVKQFKQYKENDNEKSASRDLYDILVNEYMVCVGFSKLFGDLLDKLGIENSDLSIGVDTSYDNIKYDEYDIPKEIKVATEERHARRYVHIKDEKYGIDGFYVSDPTWDNDLENDYYNHLAMTNNEAINGSRPIYFSLTRADELFSVSNLEEFKEKFDILCSKTTYRNAYKGIIVDLFNSIKELDKDYFNRLKSKYNYIYNSYPSDWPDDLSEIIYELGTYIINHVNKEISGETIMSAVEVIYKNFYGYKEEDFDTKFMEVVEKNKQRQELTFPLRFITHKDGTKEIIANEHNKFDIIKEENKML